MNGGIASLGKGTLRASPVGVIRVALEAMAPVRHRLANRSTSARLIGHFGANHASVNLNGMRTHNQRSGPIPGNLEKAHCKRFPAHRRPNRSRAVLATPCPTCDAQLLGWKVTLESLARTVIQNGTALRVVVSGYAWGGIRSADRQQIRDVLLTAVDATGTRGRSGHSEDANRGRCKQWPRHRYFVGRPRDRTSRSRGR